MGPKLLSLIPYTPHESALYMQATSVDSHRPEPNFIQSIHVKHFTMNRFVPSSTPIKATYFTHCLTQQCMPLGLEQNSAKTLYKKGCMI
eukprot:TRINITY_DN110775_c0_g1_i1.p1 TRINITY_DN110775_c0_g1~~TRINITY_DN110775_c0_g1_i1.p1  ORF type:complete len:103 (-),score=2.08 TRINITY_DN110775_c0_g1_i1:149-415(-)